MPFIVENLRLAELAAVAQSNKPVFDDFEAFVLAAGYHSLADFVREPDEARGYAIIARYLARPFPPGVALLDGIARPYAQDKARFFFLAWLFRDAPAQRLNPIVSSMPGATLMERRATILNRIRMHVAQFLGADEYWAWGPISEVMIDRLEGSRRAIKGTLFEAIVRRLLAEVFNEQSLALKVEDVEIRLEGETYDVSVAGPRGTILMPVKTRETMGGGHAGLFTRDIHKSISAAHAAGYECIPVIIAESWSGDLTSLACERYIEINMNPNQVKDIEPVLKRAIENSLPAFVALAG